MSALLQDQERAHFTGGGWQGDTKTGYTSRRARYTNKQIKGWQQRPEHGREFADWMAVWVRSRWNHGQRQAEGRKTSIESSPTIAETVQRTAIESASAFSTKLRNKIEQLAALERGWDGEQAEPVKSNVIAEVVDTMLRLRLQSNAFQEPFLAPTFDGYVQMEWRNNNHWLDIEATQTGWSSVGTLVSPDGQKEYFSVEIGSGDFSKVLELYQWLVGDELIWPSP